MCLDYSKVNQHLSVDIHSLPKLDELVEFAAGNGYYATLDMKNAYYQVMLDEASRDLRIFSKGVAPQVKNVSIWTELLSCNICQTISSGVSTSIKRGLA